MELALAEPLEKLATVKGCVKKFAAEVEELELPKKKPRAGKTFCELMVESAGLWSKLQTALSHVSVPDNNHGQRVVVDASVETDTVPALKICVAALQGQRKTMTYGIGDRAEALDKIARIGIRVTAVQSELLSSPSFLEKGAIREHREVRDSLREAVA